MGEVYRATDTRLGRDVAIKVLPELFTRDPERLVRFEREARVLASLNHPNIATIHGIEEIDGIRFLVLELVEGVTLREKFAECALPIESLVRLAIQIAEGLAKAHAAGVVHRDLKPDNLMLTEDGYVKILDFGIAARLDHGDGEKASISGTPFYMAPEQIRGVPPTPATDIYAFGATAFHLATGRPPFHKGNVIDSHLKAPPPNPLDLVPDLDPELGRIILRCLEKEPGDRYQSAAELLADLEGLSQAGG
jgi:serine/threonine protein kinase